MVQAPLCTTEVRSVFQRTGTSAQLPTPTTFLRSLSMYRSITQCTQASSALVVTPAPQTALLALTLPTSRVESSTLGIWLTATRPHASCCRLPWLVFQISLTLFSAL